MMPDNNNKVGVLTIHAARNYGSMLQAYALQTTVERIVPDSKIELIDYLPPRVMDIYSLDIRKHWKQPKRLAAFLLNYSSKFRRDRVFENFAKRYFHLTDSNYCSIEELITVGDRWDTCILGSDQVWNRDIVGDDPAFILDFVRKGRKVCYSSSFGTQYVDPDWSEKIQDRISDFDAVAVREQSAADILRAANREIFVTCDPVLLISRNNWVAISAKPEGIPAHYILYYSVERNSAAENLVKKMAEESGLPIVDAGVRNNPMGYLGIHSSDFGPQEFLNLVANADFVVTNSFHGTAFSFIFEKKVICMLHHTRGTRIRELAALAGREDCVVEEQISVSDAMKVLNCQIPKIGEDLRKNIDDSMAYLHAVLKGNSPKEEK